MVSHTVLDGQASQGPFHSPDSFFLLLLFFFFGIFVPVLEFPVKYYGKMRYSKRRAHDAEPQADLLKHYGAPGPQYTYSSVSHRIYDLRPSIIRNTTTAAPRMTKDLPLFVRLPYHLSITCSFSIFSPV